MILALKTKFPVCSLFKDKEVCFFKVSYSNSRKSSQPGSSQLGLMISFSIRVHMGLCSVSLQVQLLASLTLSTGLIQFSLIQLKYTEFDFKKQGPCFVHQVLQKVSSGRKVMCRSGAMTRKQKGSHRNTKQVT